MRRAEGRLREELGLNPPRDPVDPGPRFPRAGALAAMARASGFSRAAVVDPSLLAGADGWSRHQAILACCLSCAPGGPADLSVPGDPHALVAPFARAAYYRHAVRLLTDLSRELALTYGLPRRSFRVFANSRLPEKSLLAAAGLAAIGKNSLAIVPGLGSLFVAAGLVIPVPTARVLEAPAVRAGDPCGACDRCARACPGGALGSPGVVDTTLCLQAFAARSGTLPVALRDAWGKRLYGCQSCQDCCPHNARVAPAPVPETGRVGPSISIARLLGMDAAGRRSLFRGTAMGMNWIEDAALVRNALLAAGHAGDPAVRALVAGFTGNDEPGVRDAACWALERLAGSAPVGPGRDKGEHHEHGDEDVQQQGAQRGHA
jgi:epoxyqueuosine reductase